MLHAKSLWTDILREIWRSRTRFLSILAIIALGTGFFAGIKVTAPDMKQMAQNYYDAQQLMDIRLVSTIGFDDDDVTAVRAVSGIQGVMPSYTYDLFVQSDTLNATMRIYSLPKEQGGADDINRPVLREGRLPTQAGECALDYNAAIKDDISLGDTITLTAPSKDTDLSDVLTATELTVTGLVDSPVYIALERGSTTVGNGKLDGYVLVTPDTFCLEVYTDLFITLQKDGIPVQSEAYDTLIDEKSQQLEQTVTQSVTDRYNRLLAEAQQKIDDAQTELDDAKAQADQELADARQQLEDAKAELKKGESAYYSQKKKFEQGIQDGQEQLSAAQQQLDEQHNDLQAAVQLQQALAGLAANPAAMATAEGQALIAQSAGLDAGLPALFQAYIASLDPTVLATINQALAAVQASLADSQTQLTQAQAQLDEQSAALEKQKSQGQQALNQAWQKIIHARADLKQGQEDYTKAEAEAEEKIIDGQDEIDKARRDMLDIEKPSFFVLDRTANPGYSGFDTDADRVDAIAKIFPAFFILIAGLVSLTTMTRMVEEQRTQIGTLKALGYSRTSIMSKYLIYAVLASLCGSFPGLAIGFRLFPTVIIEAYRMMYSIPGTVTPFRWDYALWSALAAVVCTASAALMACYRELVSNPAQLMRPKAPKAGKRIFLERITFIWKRLSFIRKVTMRNLLRYKKRLLMSVLGVAGCTALMLAGFGLQDSITAILDLQFQDIIHYDVVAALDGDITAAQQGELDTALDGAAQVQGAMDVQQETLFISHGRVKKEAAVTVPIHPEKMSDFVTLRERIGGKSLTMGDDGVIINEKLALLLGVQVGDTIEINDTDRKTVSVTVDSITENYVNNYVYMTPALYETIYGYAPQCNTVLIRMVQGADDGQFDALAETLLHQDGVLGVVNMHDSITNFENVMVSLNKIVMVLIVAAGSLALIVLYNLTNINVTERIREIATLKVLGFYDNEASAYISRENTISSVLGILLGLAGGILLHRFVVHTAEVDMVMFGRHIKAMSYVYAGALTMIFTELVNLVFHFKLKKVNMVESLKSVE